MMLVNLAGFITLSPLAIPTGAYDKAWEQVGVGPPGVYVCLRILFVMSAFLASFAFWQEKAGRAGPASASLSIFLRLSWAGAAFLFFGLLSLKPFLWSIVAGVAGGILLVKTVKIKTVPSEEQLSPLQIGDFIQGDRTALVMAVAGVLAGLMILTGALFREHLLLFPMLCVFNAAWLLVAGLQRQAVGKHREILQLLVTPFLIAGVLGPLFWTGQFSPSSLVAAIPIGAGAGWFLPVSANSHTQTESAPIRGGSGWPKSKPPSRNRPPSIPMQLGFGGSRGQGRSPSVMHP